ncbi:MAG: NTP transferase domain-containing protein [Polyangiaceae bacterium]
MRELFELVQRRNLARSRGETVVLATLVRTEGSTYRKPGARAILGARGDVTGLVSGGCLEADLASHALRMGDAAWKRVSYDFRDATDDEFGLGSGCRGAFDVVLERLPPDARDGSFLAVEESVGRGAPTVRRAFVFDAGGEWASLRGTTFAVGTSAVDPSAVPEAIRVAVRDVARGRAPASLRVDGRDGFADVLVETLVPPWSLAIFGAGGDAAALAEVARVSGFRVDVFDPRTERLEAMANLPGVSRHRIDLASPGAVVDAVPFDAAVVMTHLARADRAVLATLARERSHATYLGVLGPRSRTTALLAEGDVALDAATVWGPVGLPLGASDPHGIALAVVAEIHGALAFRRDTPVHAVVLAAGASSRFGSPKIAAEFRGETLLARTIRALRAGGVEAVHVVAGAHVEEVSRIVREAADPAVDVVVHGGWASGMAGSIRAGLGAVPIGASTLVAVADQPALRASHVVRMIRAHVRSRGVVASRYDGRLAVPALFPEASRESLVALTGDAGARALLGDHAAFVDLPHGDLDVDTPDDLSRAGEVLP